MFTFSNDIRWVSSGPGPGRQPQSKSQRRTVPARRAPRGSGGGGTAPHTFIGRPVNAAVCPTAKEHDQMAKVCPGRGRGSREAGGHQAEHLLGAARAGRRA